MESDPTRINELLIGLGADVEVVSVGDEPGRPLRVLVRLRSPRPVCGSCGGSVWSSGVRRVELVDLGSFGRPVRLVLAKRRWRCPNGDCAVGTFTEQSPEIAPPRARLTSRAARRATRRVGRGRTVKETAAELGCNWHTVMREVRRWGTALLAADRGRIDGVTALGLDEILMWRHGKYRRKRWGTTIVDARRGILLDIVAGRTANPAIKWLGARTPQRRRAVRWAVMDLSGPYRKAFDTALAHARQVADPFHVVRLGNQMVDEVRRRVQNDTLGGRGTKNDPLYRVPKLLTMAHERLSTDSDAKLRGLLAAGDPRGEVRDAWHAKETLRQTCQIPSHRLARRALDALALDPRDPAWSPEMNRLGRTLGRWRTQIANWHLSRVTNGPTEAANNLAKLIKRNAFGLTNFGHYRIRALLYAGKPDWTLLDTLTPP